MGNDTYVSDSLNLLLGSYFNHVVVIVVSATGQICAWSPTCGPAKDPQAVSNLQAYLSHRGLVAPFFRTEGGSHALKMAAEEDNIQPARSAFA